MNTPANNEIFVDYSNGMICNDVVEYCSILSCIHTCVNESLLLLYPSYIKRSNGRGTGRRRRVLRYSEAEHYKTRESC